MFSAWKWFSPSAGKQQKREFKRLRAQFRDRADLRRFTIDWRTTNFNRIAVVNLLLADRPTARYLEIGCDRNDLFDAVIAKDKVGIDPARGGTLRLTSDEYFRQNPAVRHDVVFIDGLHTYEQARRDVVNALRCVGAGGWIALHDMHPLDWLEEHVPRLSGQWTGDVWKVAFELAGSPDLDFRILRIDHGVGVIRVLRDNAQIPDLRATLTDQRFGYFYDNIGSLPVVDHENGRAWIESAMSLRP